MTRQELIKLIADFAEAAHSAGVALPIGGELLVDRRTRMAEASEKMLDAFDVFVRPVAVPDPDVLEQHRLKGVIALMGSVSDIGQVKAIAQKEVAL